MTLKFPAMAGVALLCALPFTSQAAAPCYPASDDAPLEKELVLSSMGGTFWEAFRDAYVTPFEQACGVRVKLVVTPQHGFGQLRGYVRRGTVPFDLTYTAVPWEIAQARDERLIDPLPVDFWQPIADTLLPGSYNQEGTWLTAYAEALAYNTQVFPEGLHSWAQFWDTARYPGARTLYDHPFSLIVALLADGVAPDALYPIDDGKLKRAFAKLDQLRPSIRSFWTGGGDEPVQGIARGDFVAGVVQTGRALAGQRAGYPIGVSWQQHIANQAWLFRPKGAAHPRAAAALMYFMNDPQRQAQFAKRTGYGGAPHDSERYLDAEQASHLTTSAANRVQAVPIDLPWWQANGARTQQLWQQWVATGKVPL